MKKHLRGVFFLTTTVLTLSSQAETPIVFDPIPSRVNKNGNRHPIHAEINQNIEEGDTWNIPRKRDSAPKGLQSVTSNGSEIRAFANMWYKGDWDYDTPVYGIYSFPTVSGTYYNFPSVAKNQLICGNAGAVYANGKYFVATAEEVNAPNGGYVVMSMKFHIFDTETWTYTEIPDADEEFKAMDMAYDPTTDQVYGCFVKRGTNGYYYFGTFDIETGEVRMIKNYGQSSDHSFTGIAISDDGDIYAINSKGTLCRIDKATGDASTIGETGLADQYMTSAAYEPVSGKIYYALNTDNLHGMYEINPTNAVAKRVYSFLDEEAVAGMYFPEAAPHSDSPAAPTSVTATFPNGALNGTVSFTAPTKTYEGTTLTGTLNYTIKANGKVRATGTTTPNKNESIPVSVETSGDYSIAVTCSNAAGNGETGRTRLFIGNDTPMPVENVKLAYSDGKFTLSWDAAKAVHGGYMNPANLTYVVTRHPDATVTTVTVNSMTETLPEPPTRTRYYYTVAASLDGTITPPTPSNPIMVGTYKAPCTMTFDSADDMDDFVMVDGDKDGKTWVWDSGQMHSSICLTSNANDYMILPPVYLTRGMSYRVAIDAKATRSPLKVYPERIALWAGNTPTAEGMSVRILNPTDITSDQYSTLTCDFTPDKDGAYYFAVQSCSDIDSYYLWVDNFSVSEPVRSHVPNPVKGLTALAGENGALTAQLSFTLPTTDMTGAALASISKVEIFRNNALLETISGAPGEKITYTDTKAPNGIVTYGVAVTSDNGTSLRESTEVYIGVHRPVAVTNIRAVNGSDNGEIILKWDAPATDIEGIQMPEGSVTYRVTRYDRTVTEIADAHTATILTDRAAEADTPQEFVQYSVTAINIAGESDAEYSNTTTYGKLIPAPVNESFAEGYATLEFVVERADDNASWTVTNPSSNPGIEDQDDDGGLLRFVGVTTGDRASFISGNFSVDNLAEPALVFYFLYPKGTDRGIEATLYWENDGELRQNTVEARPQPGLEGWQRCIVPISPEASKVQFVLTGENFGEYATTIFIDNISILDLPTPNMTMNRFTAPKVVEAGQPFPLTAYIENSGAHTAEATVDLYLNGEVVDSRSMSLDMSEHAAVTFNQTLGVVNPKEMVYHAEVTTEGDRVASDNRSASVSVGVHQNIYPAPQNASARTENGHAAIRWNEPDLGPATPVRITDDVEGYVPFSIGMEGTEIAADYLGQWTTTDADGLYTLGVGHGSVAIPNATVPKAFMAFNAPAGNLTGSAWECHSGTTMFVAFSAIADYGDHNDDWLISPLLTGEAQEIKFFARSATDLYGLESMEILYSTSGTATSDFKLIEADTQVPVEWKEYTAQLPAGTRYFAIRCVSANLFALCVDDISFIPAGFRGMGVELSGYNLYRDGIRLNTSPITATEYTDRTLPPGSKPTYHVTALYNVGESRPSNDATLDQSGLNSTETSANISVRASQGHLVIEGAIGVDVTVALPDGRIIYSGTPSDSPLLLPVASGTYLVRAASATFKVAVR